MSTSQQMTWNSGLRDVNQAGYVILDNRADNFGFVGSQLVVVDTGGIIKIRVPPGRSITRAEAAREIQLIINGTWENRFPHPDLRGTVNPYTRNVVRRYTILDDYWEYFDLEAIYGTDFGIASMSETARREILRNHIPFNPESGEQFAYAAHLFDAE